MRRVLLLLKSRMCFTSTRESIRLQGKSRSAITLKAADGVVTKFLTVSIVDFTFINVCKENKFRNTGSMRDESLALNPLGARCLILKKIPKAFQGSPDK